MGMFDYRGEDGREIIGEAYALASYTATATGTTVPDGWEVLSASDLGISPLKLDAYGYFTADGTFGGQAKVLVKRAADGSVEQLTISFAATNSLFDVYDYTAMSLNTYDEAFDYVLDAAADYAQDAGLSGEDVILTGYSLGAGAVNNVANDKHEQSGGFYEDSNFIAFASPAFEHDDNVYNFGFENDGVFQVDVFNAGESSTDNIVLFNDAYSSPYFGWAGTTIANLDTWEAHIDGFTYTDEIFNSIADSHFYDLMDRDSLVIIANLEGSERNTWVEPVDRPTGNHDGDDAFIMGNSGDDRLRGDGGDDFLDGHAGDDEINGRGGDDQIFGGAGDDELTGGSGSDTFIFAGNFGDDTITDFGSSDIIEIDSSIFSNYNELMANADEVGGGWFSSGDVVIEAGSNSITLEGVELSDLNSNDFMFV